MLQCNPDLVYWKQVELQSGDVSWSDFIACASGSTEFSPHIADIDDITNILFSSGTTGTVC